LQSNYTFRALFKLHGEIFGDLLLSLIQSVLPLDLLPITIHSFHKVLLHQINHPALLVFLLYVATNELANLLCKVSLNVSIYAVFLDFKQLRLKRRGFILKLDPSLIVVVQVVIFIMYAIGDSHKCERGGWELPPLLLGLEEVNRRVVQGVQGVGRQLQVSRDRQGVDWGLH